MVSSPTFDRFSLVETVLYQSAQIGFLDVSAGNVLGQVGLLSGSVFGKGHCPSCEVRREGSATI